MSELNPSALVAMSDLDLALYLAELSDAISMARFQAVDLRVETKPDLTPVSDADKAIEEEIRRVLAIARPSDQIVGEEFGSGDKGGRYWVIDPIDGTKNFVRGVPVWASLIALMEVDQVLVGVVSAPALFRRWFASKGGGAYLQVTSSGASSSGASSSSASNPGASSSGASSSSASNPGASSSGARRIQVSAITRLEDASLSISTFASPNTGNRNDGWGDLHGGLLRLAEKVWRTRGYGDFWSHMLVAEGAVDCALEPRLALWDMAPLSIILHEAGGRFTDFNGVDGPNGANGISSNGQLHEEILRYFAS